MSAWSDINKKILNYKVESSEKLKPYIDYDPKDFDDPNNPDNPNYKPKIVMDIEDEGVQAVRNAINNIMHTRIGELPGEPEFGSNPDRWLFQQMDGLLASIIESDVRTTIERWEPRVNILGVDVLMNPDYNEVVVDIRFTINPGNSGQVFTHRVTYGAR